MKKAGLYDQYRYPNRLHLSTDTVSTNSHLSGTTRGREGALGSGYRLNNPASGGGRNTPVQLSQPNASNIPHSISGAGTFEIHDDVDLILPRRRRVSRYGWVAFGLQVITMLMVITVFLGPGWGRSKRDARTEIERSYVYNYHGFWLLCTEQAFDGPRTCTNNLLVDKEGWWVAVQALGCAFLVLSFICLLLISFFVFRIKSNRKWTLSVTHALVSILNCLVLLSCILTFAINFKDHSWWCCPNGHRITESILFWAWYLAIAAFVSQLVSLSMTITETYSLRR